jgi:hypothetical protein
MNQLLRSLYNNLTYRNEYTDPDPADGLHISHKHGTRTVHHPDLPAYLEARRRRILLEGLAPIDWALMDPDTARRLLLTQATCPQCICDPITCTADDSGGHCQDRSCGSCLHGCPTDECNPAGESLHQAAACVPALSRQQAQ